MNNPKDYTNHSGGAKGADLEWDKIGREFGVENHIHYRPSDIGTMGVGQKAIMLADVKSAAEALGRPHIFKGVELVQRNWFQVHYSQAIFAIGYIVEPDKTDFRGFVNKTGKHIVAGGTGWAVEMAIQKNKPVYIFDMEENCWVTWVLLDEEDFSSNQFFVFNTPILTPHFAGIGSRQITPLGEQAIRDVYTKTFEK